MFERLWALLTMDRQTQSDLNSNSGALLCWVEALEGHRALIGLGVLWFFECVAERLLNLFGL